LFCTATAGFMPDTLKNRIRGTESAAMFARAGDKILIYWRSGATTHP
jgi:hypothetical protein